MTAIADLRPRIAPETPNAPHPLMDRAIREAARELCGVPLWQDTVTIAPVADTRQYTLQAPVVDAEIVRLLPPLQIDGCAYRGRYDRKGPRMLVFDEVPEQTLTAAVALRPSVDASTLPDVLALDYADGVVSGALYRMLRMPGVAWRQPELAMVHRRLFRKWRMEAAAAIERGFVQASVRSRPRRFAAFRR